jgi:hypothetical protein
VGSTAIGSCVVRKASSGASTVLDIRRMTFESWRQRMLGRAAARDAQETGRTTVAVTAVDTSSRSAWLWHSGQTSKHIWVHVRFGDPEDPAGSNHDERAQVLDDASR